MVFIRHGGKSWKQVSDYLGDDGEFEISMPRALGTLRLQILTVFHLGDTGSTEGPWRSRSEIQVTLPAEGDVDLAEILLKEAAELCSISGRALKGTDPATIKYFAMRRLGKSQESPLEFQWGIQGHSSAPNVPSGYIAGNRFLAAHLRPARYALMLFAGGLWTDPKEVSVLAGQTLTDVAFSVPEAQYSVTGRIVDAKTGDSIANMSINISSVARPEWPQVDVFEAEALSDADGRFLLRFRGFPEDGKMRLWIIHDDYARWGSPVNATEFSRSVTIVKEIRLSKDE